MKGPGHRDLPDGRHLFSSGLWTEDKHRAAVRQIEEALEELRAVRPVRIQHIAQISRIPIADGEVLVSIAFVIPKPRGSTVTPPDPSTVATADRPPSGDAGR